MQARIAGKLKMMAPLAGLTVGTMMGLGVISAVEPPISTLIQT